VTARSLLTRIGLYLLLLLWSAVCLFPLYWVLLASLKSEDAIVHGPRFFPFVDFMPTLDAWQFVLFDSHENLLKPLFNSLLVSGVSTVIATVSACLLIYAATRFQGPRYIKNDWLLWATFATRIIAPACLIIPIYMMAWATGLLDNQLALIATYSAYNLPVAVWLLIPVFGNRATDQEEAALLEGASHFFVLRDILLPMVLPSIASASLIVFILCWNEYFFAAYLTTNHAATLTPWMVGQLSLKEAQIGGEAEEWAHLSAATVLMVAPLLLFAATLQRMLGRSSVAK
jgi:multiple sugar transport system permease protein